MRGGMEAGGRADGQADGVGWGKGRRQGRDGHIGGLHARGRLCAYSSQRACVRACHYCSLPCLASRLQGGFIIPSTLLHINFPLHSRASCQPLPGGMRS